MGSARQALADETAAARAELGNRETAVADRENLVTETEQSQADRDKDLARRERLLREAPSPAGRSAMRFS